MRHYIILLLLSSGLLKAQTLKIINSDTGETVPYATAILKNDGKEVEGLYSDEEGRLTLPASGYNTAEFSCLGFATKSIDKSSLYEVVQLKPQAIELKELAIAIRKDTLIGGYGLKRVFSNPFGVGHHMAVYFDNPAGYDVPLKEIWLKLAKIKYTTVVRVHVYSRKDYQQEYYLPGDAGKKTASYDSFIPGEELLQQNIIAELKPETGNDAKINLQEYNVTLPAEGAFVALEVIGFYNELNQAVIKPSQKDMTTIEMHKAVNDNYCQKVGLVNTFWVNINKWLMNDYKAMDSKPPRNTFKTPTMGLVIAK